MSAKIFHNPRCSKSRQSLQLLNENEQDIEIIEYLKTPPSTKDLREIIDMLGIEARTLLRKGEAEYQQAGLDQDNVSDEQIIAAMVKYPKLIERPIVIKEGKAIIGRPPENILTIL